jgi:hypothetical protein
MKRIGSAVVIGCVMATVAGIAMAEDTVKDEARALLEKQKAEREAFRNEVKEKKAEEASQHEKNVAYLKKQLAQSQLTDGQREEIVALIESQLGDKISLDDQRLRDLVDYIKKLSFDEKKSLAEKKELLKAWIIKKKEEAQEERAKEKARNK